MSSIDERIVSMKFDAGSFQSGIKTTLSSLAALKNGLKLGGATKGLTDLDAAGRKAASGLKFDGAIKDLGGLNKAAQGVSFNPILNGQQKVSAGFVAMATVGITALSNIVNKAVNAGTNIAKSLTVEPIMDGFREYEVKMGAIQTILANTSKAGTTLEDVTASLDSLNTYADKTIYNFAEMTKNIGLFTNAGIGLEDATSMIKGFSNEAAASGTTSQGAAGAAYQLSQALSSGTIRLMDWKSLTNVGMGNKNMQNGLIEIADAMGTLEKNSTSATEVSENFNASLEKEWLTADVMQNYLKIQAGELNAERMAGLGLSEKQIESFLKQQKIAEDAATKVRTLTQLMGTLKEAVGSSWASTFDILFGDFNEATELFTNVNNTLGSMFAAQGDARNDMLKSWSDLGGRTAVINAISNAFKALMGVLTPITEAFKEIFPPMTAQRLFEMTKSLEGFTKTLIPGEEAMANIKRTARGLFAIFDIGWHVIKLAAQMFADLFFSASDSAGSILDFTGDIGDFLVKVRDAIKNGTALNDFFNNLGLVLHKVLDIFKKVGTVLKDFFGKLGEFEFDTTTMEKGIDRLTTRLDPLATAGDKVKAAWEGILKGFKAVKEFLTPVGEAIADFFMGLGEKVAAAVGDINFDTLLDIFNTGFLAGIFLLFKKYTSGGGLVDQLKDAFFGGKKDDDGGGFLDSIKEAFGGLTDTLGAMQANLKSGTLLKIAGAIALLTVSVVALSMIDSAKLAKALGGISVMMTQLVIAMVVLEKVAASKGFLKMPFIAASMILLSTAVLILSAAVKNMSDLDWNELLKGLTGVAALMAVIAGTSKLMAKNSKGLISASIGMIAVAIAVRLLVSAVKDFSEIRWQSLAKGLIGVGVVLGALALFTRLSKVNKGAMASSAGLILLGVALKIMASVVKDFSEIKASSLVKGLGAITGVLGALALFTRIASPAGVLRTATAMVILGGAMKIMASALEDFTKFKWEELGRGGAGFAGALMIIAGAMNLMPKNMLFTAAALAIVAGSLTIVADVLDQMSGMSWDEIGRGLTVLAASLVVIAGAMFLMSGAIPGALALIVVAGALSLLTPVLTTLGEMSWEEIGKGLAALAGALVLIGLAGLILTPVVPSLIGLGIAIGLLGVGVALVGVGLLAFATGLTALAAAGAAGTAALVAIVAGLLGLIPLAFRKFGEGLIELAWVISEGGPAIVAALVTILDSVLTAIDETSPKIINTLWNLVVLMTEKVIEGVPYLLDAGARLLIAVLNGIAQRMPQIGVAATNVIVAFLNSIAQNMPRITQAGANLIITFVESLATSVRNNSERMRSAGMDLAGAIIDGMTGGLFSRAQEVANEAARMASNAFEAAKRALKINSPSKLFIGLGEGTGEGLIVGMQNMDGGITKASRGMASTAFGALKGAMSKIGDVLNDDLDFNPTIRPILDLSDVRKEAASVGGLFGGSPLALDSSYSKASYLSSATTGSDSSTSTDGNVVGGGTSLTFIQNNTSPKPINAAETYRNTRNQISRAKGVLAGVS